jgi:hypothetical protein
MASQSHSSKRTYSQRISEEGALITRSQPPRSAALKRRQSTLVFSQPAPREALPRATPTPPPQRSPSLSPSQDSSIHPSESVSVVSRTKTPKILASQRCHFEVDFSGNLDGYRRRARTIRTVGNGKISWIYLHGIEIEKQTEKGLWTRYWLYRLYYRNGVSKPRPVASTSSCASHLHKHEIFAPG